MTAKEILKVASIQSAAAPQVQQVPQKKKKSFTMDRAYGIGQAGAAGAGAVAGYRNPHLFDPKVVSSKLNPRKFGGRLASGALGAATMAGLAWLPEVVHRGVKSL